MSKVDILTTHHTVVRPDSRESAWQREIRLAVRDAATLCQRLGLPPALAEGAEKSAGQFPLFVPPSFLARMRYGDPDDPLLRQVLPVAEEHEPHAVFSTDPVGDGNSQLQPGLLQKYSGRALLIATGVCAVHCRYCFRRHYPYETIPHSTAAWQDALEAVAADASVHEIILSGGDPLMLVDSRLRQLVELIEAIPHVARLRIHTRLPIMIPARVTLQFVQMLASSRCTTVVVVHANHANELDSQVGEAFARLRESGSLLLNQAVLLRGVNDTAAAQKSLSERLLELGVIPYYLHQLDRVIGAAHFEVPIAEGRRIIEELRQTLPGYAVPRYVQEIPGEPNKTVLM